VAGTAELQILIRARDEMSGALGNMNTRAGGLASTLRGALQTGALAAGAAIVGLGAVAINMARDFETSFTEVTTLFDGPREQVDALRRGVLDLSAEMGVDAKSAAEALYQAISAGVSPDNAIDFLRQNTRLAVAGVTDLSTAVDLTTTVMNAWGLESSELTRVTDVLMAGVRAGKTTVDELGASIFQVAPAASAAGVSIEEVTAGLATLTASGVPTSVAATSLRAAVIELGREGTKVGEAFEQVAGVGFREFIAGGGDMVDAVKVLNRAAEDSGVAVGDLFTSVEAGGAITTLAGEGFEAFADNLDAARDSAGLTDVAYERMNATFDRQFSILQNQLKVIMIDIGSRVLPLLTSAMMAISPIINQVADAITILGEIAVAAFQRRGLELHALFLQLPEGMRPFAQTLVELVRFFRDTMIPIIVDLARQFSVGFQTIIDALRPVFEYVITHKEAMIAAIAAIGLAIVIALGPASLAVLALVALPILIGAIQEHWDEIKSAIQNDDWLEEKFGEWAIAFIVIREVVTAFVAFIRENWEAIRTIIVNELDLIRLVIQNMLDTVHDLFRIAGAIFRGDWGEAWDGIQNLVSDRLDFIRDVFINRLQVFHAIFVIAWAVIVAVVATAWDVIVQVVTDSISDLRDRIVGGFEAVRDAFVAAWGGVRDVFTFAFAALVGMVAALPQRFIDALVNLPTMLYDIGRRAVQGFIDGLLSIPLPDLTPGFDIPGVPFLHHGGIVPGLPGRPVLAMLEAGERVIARSGAGQGGGTTIINNNTVNTRSDSPEEIARAVEFVTLAQGQRLAMEGV